MPESRQCHSDVPPPKPKDVPESYVMIPFDIKKCVKVGVLALAVGGGAFGPVSAARLCGLRGMCLCGGGGCLL